MCVEALSCHGEAHTYHDSFGLGAFSSERAVRPGGRAAGRRLRHSSSCTDASASPIRDADGLMAPVRAIFKHTGRPAWLAT